MQRNLRRRTLYPGEVQGQIGGHLPRLQVYQKKAACSSYHPPVIPRACALGITLMERLMDAQEKLLHSLRINAIIIIAAVVRRKVGSNSNNHTKRRWNDA